MGKTGFALISIPYGLGAIAASSPHYQAFLGRFLPRFRDSLPHCYALNTLGFVLTMALVYFYTVSYTVYLMQFLIAFFHVSVRITRISELMRRCSAENVSQILAFNHILLSVISIILFTTLGVISDYLGFWHAWFFVFCPECCGSAWLFVVLQIGTLISIPINAKQGMHSQQCSRFCVLRSNYFGVIFVGPEL